MAGRLLQSQVGEADQLVVHDPRLLDIAPGGAHHRPGQARGVAQLLGQAGRLQQDVPGPGPLARSDTGLAQRQQQFEPTPAGRRIDPGEHVKRPGVVLDGLLVSQHGRGLLTGLDGV